MKHLKSFTHINEDIIDIDFRSKNRIKNESLLEEINDLFLQYSTYLLDDEFDYDIDLEENDRSINLSVYKPTTYPGHYSKKLFTWKEIKNDFIQVCEVLSKKFEIESIVILRNIDRVNNLISNKADSGLQKLKIVDILDDKVNDDKVIRSIVIVFKTYTDAKPKTLLQRFKNIFKK